MTCHTQADCTDKACICFANQKLRLTVYQEAGTYVYWVGECMTTNSGRTYDPKHPQGNHPQKQQLCVNEPWLIHHINR